MADRRFIDSKACYRNFYQRCVKEIEDMKKTKFCNNISIFEVVMKSEKVTSDCVGYIKYNELMERLRDRRYQEKYPIYFGLLKKRFHTVMEKKKLRYVASIILNNLFMFKDRRHPVCKKILSFLRNQDLRFLEM